MPSSTTTMSTTNNDATSPLLPPATTSNTDTSSFRSQILHVSVQSGLRGAIRLLGQNIEESVTVRENAAQHIEERQSNWAYSTPIVIIDILLNIIFVFFAIVMVIISSDEVMKVPLRLWLIGYGVQCVLHMVCVVIEHKRRRRRREMARRPSLTRSSRINLRSEVNLEEEFVDERHHNQTNTTSVAKHLQSANTWLSFIWWIVGFYWISTGGPTLANDAPKLYWLTVTFMAIDVCFVVICVVVACFIGIAVCCCLPYIIAVLYVVAEQDGANIEDIDRLPRYKFMSVGQVEKKNGEIEESFGGIMTECNTDTPMEHVLSEQDAKCVICLAFYEGGSELRELPCHHHFHSACIDKWLLMKATCPLCNYQLPRNGQQIGEQV